MRKKPESDYQILKLTKEFYLDYPNPPNTELLKKEGRAYNCLIFQTHYNFFICIPYRTEISHKYSFRFNNTKRSMIHNSGLDYTKIIIANKNSYLDSKLAIIDKDEYNETVKNIEKIKSEALEYVECYIDYINGNRKISDEEFTRRYQYSSLVHFHKELGISTK